MWCDEPRTTLFLWLAGIGPGEGVGHRGVVIPDEFLYLRLQICYGREVASAYQLPVDDSEYDLDLVEPRTVLRKVDETNSVIDI